MKYEKPQAEIIKFDFDAFIRCSGDTPIGKFTCGSYTQGASCSSVTWPGTGYSCGSFSSGNCQSVYAPPGSDGDGCHAWKLTCSNF